MILIAENRNEVHARQVGLGTRIFNSVIFHWNNI